MTPHTLENVVIVGSVPDAERARTDLGLAGGARILQPTRTASARAAYRGAQLGVVCAPRAFVAAAAAQLVLQIPWIAVLGWDADGARRAPPTTRRALARAAAIIAPAATHDALRSFAPRARLVAREDGTRVRTVLADVALPPDAHPAGGRLLGPVAVGAWMFVDDRLTRLAIRLVKMTGKAPRPMHPHHLLQDASHRWYEGLVGRGDRVLDVGCGHAAHSLELAKRGARVVGIDVDASAIEQAREEAARLALTHAEFHVLDLTDPDSLTMVGTGFDVALALDVLEHLVDRSALLVGLRKLLKPGGRLVVAVPNADTTYKSWRRRLGGTVYSNPDHKIEFTEVRIRTELADAGFAIERFEYGGYDTPFHGMGALLGAVSLPLYRRLTSRRHSIVSRRPDKASAFRIVAAPSALR